MSQSQSLQWRADVKMPHTSNVPSHSLIIQKIKNEEGFKLQNHNNKDAKTFLSSWFEVIFNFVQIKFRCFPCYCGLFVCLFLRVNGLRGTFLVSHSNKETEAGSPDITQQFIVDLCLTRVLVPKLVAVNFLNIAHNRWLKNKEDSRKWE